MNKDATILIAGASGLVGSALLRRLKQEQYTNILTPRSSEVDFTRQRDVEEYFASERPQYVFLAAAKVGGILANSTYPADFIYTNIAITSNIIHTAYQCGVTKLLNLGSSCIYPKLAPQPLTEDSLLTSALEETNEAYAIAKIAGIKLCKYYNEQYSTNFISVMPTNLYGQGDNFNMETAHLLPMLLRRFHLAKCLQQEYWEEIYHDLERYPLGWGLDAMLSPDISHDAMEAILARIGVYRDRVVVWGDGSVYRELMSSDEMADACIYLMQHKDYHDIGEFVNITSGEDILLRDLITLIRDTVGFNGAISYDTTKPNGTPRKRMSTTKLHALGWKTTHNIAQGIQDVYRWYCTHSVYPPHNGNVIEQQRKR